MVRTIAIWVLLLFSAAAGSACGPDIKAELVLLGGTVYTANDSIPKVTSLAIHADSILAVGTEEQIDALIDENTAILSLAGLTATPGIIERDGDLLRSGYRVLHLNLQFVTNYDQLIQLVEERAADMPRGTWIMGTGWNAEERDPPPADPVYGYPRHDRLSQVSPDNPVWLKQLGDRDGLTNAFGMSLSGVTGTTFFNGQGTILKDRNGFPTGIFTDAAQAMMEDLIPSAIPGVRGSSEVAHAVALDKALLAHNHAGITSVRDTSFILSEMAARGGPGATVLELFGRHVTFKREERRSGGMAGNQNVALESRHDPSSAMDLFIKAINASPIIIGGDVSASRHRALVTLTAGPARQDLAEARIGQLMPGKLADIVVFSQDILNVPTDRLPSTEVEFTIVDGNISYRK